MGKAMGVDRTYLNKVLQGARRPGAQILRALGLQTTVVCAGSDYPDFMPILLHAVLQAGSISECSRQTGIDRTVVSLVIHGRRMPTAPFFRALKQMRLIAYVAQAPKGRSSK
jgi:hypothetical protein